MGRAPTTRIALGLGACVLPGVVAALGAWWRADFGLVLGVVCALVFSWRWVNAMGRKGFWLGALVGCILAAVFAMMWVPAVRVTTGLFPTLHLSTERPDLSATFRFADAEPFGPAHVGPPTRRKTSPDNTYYYRYYVVQPLKKKGSDGSSPVQAWAVCKSDQDKETQTQLAKQECEPLLAAPDAFWTDVTGSMSEEVTAARTALGLKARPDAWVARRVKKHDVSADLFMPIVTMLVFGAGSVMQTRKHSAT